MNAIKNGARCKDCGKLLTGKEYGLIVKKCPRCSLETRFITGMIGVAVIGGAVAGAAYAANEFGSNEETDDSIEIVPLEKWDDSDTY